MNKFFLLIIAVFYCELVVGSEIIEFNSCEDEKKFNSIVVDYFKNSTTTAEKQITDRPVFYSVMGFPRFEQYFYDNGDGVEIGMESIQEPPLKDNEDEDIQKIIRKEGQSLVASEFKSGTWSKLYKNPQRDVKVFYLPIISDNNVVGYMAWGFVVKDGKFFKQKF